MEKNATLKPYLCPKCHIYDMDPLNQPIRMLCNAYKVPAGSSNAAKFFDVDSNTLTNVKSASGTLQVQMRCLKLNGEGREHSWPKHGWLRFNGKQLMPLTQPPEKYLLERERMNHLM